MATSQQVDKVLCSVCGYPAVKKRIFCQDCGGWSHVSCAEKKKCCEQNVLIPVPDDDDKIPAKFLLETINELSATVHGMKKVIEELITENKKLRVEIEDMRGKKRESNIEMSRVDDDAVVEEAMDRIYRSNNVIVQCLQEPHGDDVQRKRADEDAVKNLIGPVIEGNQEYQILSVIRLGKPNQERSRMVKVVLNSSAVVKKLVRHRFSNNIFCNVDLTPRQQTKAYAIRKEFRSRRNNGEEDIRLKYTNGVPKIVSTKNV
ncbi:hypothetical protein Zmor_000022 [Zophobas morio]|uniref:Uncharacterized protein n=1 Tax=Zophobas morio TaxID=2755281 RepID=A0AA38J0R0_9CUCU|nr:hypothetical protein Zmor_000022 [Zophobas morio]